MSWQNHNHLYTNNKTFKPCVTLNPILIIQPLIKLYIDILSNPDPYWCIGKSVSLNWVNVFLRLGQHIDRLLFQNMFIYLCKLNIYKLKGSMSFLNVYLKL